MLWHPAKWWTHKLTTDELKEKTTNNCVEGGTLPLEFANWPDEKSPQQYSNPPGQLDSGQYMWDLSGKTPFPLHFYYQCLTCCCTPAKCDLPQEILMTISGFDGILSSIDRPSAFGYAPANVCPDCNIMWTGNCPYTDAPGHRWSGYDNAACCRCRTSENFQWWPCTANSISLVPSTLCDTFPHLCSSGPGNSTSTPGRIAARFIDPCVDYFNNTSACTDFVWSDYDRYPDYSLVELTRCANAPQAVNNERADYTCITRNPVEFVRENDSYLWPPGFRGPGAVNLMPLCANKFWNDTTYYRYCVGHDSSGIHGNFWCQGDCWINHCYCAGGWWGLDADFFYRLTSVDVRNDAWQLPGNKWCSESPTRCNGPVPVTDVDWNYYRPDYVLISQPSKQNCMLCPAYGYGYGSDGWNYGRGDNWYDPSDDGNCIGKTDVPMSDFNQTFMMYSEVTPDPPYLKGLVYRARNKPNTEKTLIDAELIFQVKQYVQGAPPDCTCFQYKQGYWNLDYPCEPKEWDDGCECVVCPAVQGAVAPKLQAFYLGKNGAMPGGDAVIKFRLRPYCSTVSQAGVGSILLSGAWYVSAVFVDEQQRGAEYVIGDEFVFDYYESPLRGGETYYAGKGGVARQRARVTEVSNDGEILGIELVVPENTPELYTKCVNAQTDPNPFAPFIPWVPLYLRLLPHRNAVAIPGNGYVEGDVIVFENTGGAPNTPLFTGHKYYPYARTDSRYRSLAKATVVEVDSRGGIKDWYMCGAKNTFSAIYKTAAENSCAEDNTGIYFADYQYTNRCEYNYVGYIPVKYGWTGWFDYHFHKETYCGYTWAKFTYKIDQISIRNTVTVGAPWRVLDAPYKRPLLEIDAVKPMTLYGESITPLRYQNWERSPGPSARATYTSDGNGNYRWYKNHDFPVNVKQGAVLSIRVVEPGAGFVRKVFREDGSFYWVPLIVSTATNADCPIYIQGVSDDIRDYAETCWGWPAHCKCEARIIMDEDDPNFGGIDSIRILDGNEDGEGKGGLWYFVHPAGLDHVWFAKAGSDWYFELADPITRDNPNPRNIDYSDVNGADCWHASRDNWGELQHKAGFYEPYPSRYKEGSRQLIGANGQPYTYYYYNCGVGDGAWPSNPRSMGGEGEYPVAPALDRWSLQFCPNDLLNKSFDMLLIHPCAACAKEMNISGAQTCWNMAGFGDSSYSRYPNQWAGTGTAMIDALGGPLTMSVSRA